MASIYSICNGVRGVEEMIRSFSHPLVDCARTKVITDVTPRQSSLEVQLYDGQGNYLLQDSVIGEGYTFPGLLLTLHPREQEMRIESIYVKPQYYGRGIGTAFVRQVMQGAKKEGYRRIRVVADDTTNAVEYWRRVHGFEAADVIRPLVLEKRI